MSTLRLVKIDDLVVGSLGADIYLDESGTLSRSKYLPITKEYIDNLIELDISELYLTTATSSTEKEEENYSFDTFIDHYKLFSKVYFKCVEKTRVIIQGFEKTNFIMTSDLQKIVDELFYIVSSDSSSVLNILNVQTYDKATSLYARLVNVSLLSMLIGVALKIPEEAIKKIGLGGLLYDIGMINVPKQILNKFGKYNEEEFRTMQKHTVYGYRIMKHILRLENDVATIALTHHEYYNGKGYPRALSGDQIHIYSKIVAIAQAIDGMLKNHTAYFKDKMSLSAAMKEIMKEASTKFDPSIVKVFVSILGVYPVGSVVVLNDSRHALVFRLHKNFPIRPVVKVISNDESKYISNGETIDLLNKKDIYITNVESDSTYLTDIQNTIFETK